MKPIVLAVLLLSPAAFASPPIEETPTETLLAQARESLRAMGPYRVLLTEQERVRGKLLEPQQIQLWIREEPLAVRLLYVGGPAKGRKGLYDSAVRPGDLRVREAGFLGIAGPIWIGIHNSLCLRDTNHPVTDVGFGALIRLEGDVFEKAKAFGGFTRTDEGMNQRGHHCLRFDAPKGAKGLYALRSRICIDPATALPVEMTNWDSQGLLETYEFDNLEPGGAKPADFTRDAAGL
ncbi:MAG TPA: DUF1571 domain-containing protein [Myxococcales bacterium]|nr:DUF1571 domain-containing protein [Myxococcales bacterium]